MGRLGKEPQQIAAADADAADADAADAVEAAAAADEDQALVPAGADLSAATSKESAFAGHAGNVASEMQAQCLPLATTAERSLEYILNQHFRLHLPWRDRCV